MIYFALGVIVGVLLAAVAYAAGRRWERKVDDTVEKIASLIGERAAILSDEGRAEIFEPTPPEVEAMEAVIGSNKERGRDTRAEEL